MTRVIDWVLGISGAIAVFLGLFILFGGESQSIGLGGDLTWQVGEISSAWGYGLTIGGAALLMVTLAVVLWERSHPQEHRHESEFAGLMWHIGIFAVVNGFLWIQDIAAGGGLDYAYWTTIPWGIGLISHAVVYIVQSHRPDSHPDDSAPIKPPHGGLPAH